MVDTINEEINGTDGDDFAGDGSGGTTDGSGGGDTSRGDGGGGGDPIGSASGDRGDGGGASRTDADDAGTDRDAGTVGSGGDAPSSVGSGSSQSGDSGDGGGDGGGGDRPVRKRRSRRGANVNAEGTAEPAERPLVLDVVPDAAEFREAGEPAARKPRGAGKISAETGAEMIAGGFSVASMLRPVYLREAWDYSVSDCKEAGAKLASILNRMPTKYVNLMTKYADPVMLALILNSMYAEGRRREAVLTERYNAFLETQRSAGRGPGTVESNQSRTARNGTGHVDQDGNGADVGLNPRAPDIPFQDN